MGTAIKHLVSDRVKPSSPTVMSIYFRFKFGNSKSNCLRLLIVGVEIWALCSESEMAGVVGGRTTA